MAGIVFPRYPYHGQVHRVPEISASYIFDKTRDSWYFEAISGGAGGGGGGSNVTISETPPSTPNNGDLWISSDTYFLYVFDQSIEPAGQWVGITNNGGDNTLVHIGSYAPDGQIAEGQMWFDAETGDLRILYSDTNSSQWVTVTSNGQSLGVTSNIIRILEDQITVLRAEIDTLREEIDNIDGSTIIEAE